MQLHKREYSLALYYKLTYNILPITSCLTTLWPDYQNIALDTRQYNKLGKVTKCYLDSWASQS